MPAMDPCVPRRWSPAFSTAILALAGLFLPAGCSGEPPEPAPDAPSYAMPSPGGRVVFGGRVEPKDLNCLRETETPAVTICDLIADTLLTYDSELNIIPRLAESFVISPDRLSITLNLRQGVKWHDGTPFTIKDVLYTVERIRDPGSNIQGQLPSQFEAVKSIETPDEWTLVARYDQASVVAIHTWAKVFIMPAHLPFGTGEPSGLGRRPVGTGPFRFESWTPGQEIFLKANDDYFLGRPLLDEFIMRYVDSGPSIVFGLTSGELDVTPLPAGGLRADDPDIEVHRYPLMKVRYILWNIVHESRLLSDPKVRKAISLALNRAAYVNIVAKDHPTLAVSTFIPGSWAHDPDLAPLPYDPEQAAALFREAGWIDRNNDGLLETPHGPAEFTLLVLAGHPDVEIGEMLKESLATLGVNVNLVALEWKVMQERKRGGSFQGLIAGWGLDVDPDPFDFFHSSQASGGQNYGGYSNLEVDRLSEEGRLETDPGKRARIYHQIERILVEEQPYTFIYHNVATVGRNRRVQGMRIGQRGVWGWQPGILSWWIPEKERRSRR
jgi:peptide/nickel transport system substrate-binding protein